MKNETFNANAAVSDELPFIELYEKKKMEAVKLREEIITLLDIGEKTFYRKLQDDSWKKTERVLISQHLGIDSAVLFPTKED